MKTRSSAPLLVPPATKSNLPVKARPAARPAKLPGFRVGERVPESYSRLLLHLPGGTSVRGVWTGEKWWADGGEVFPERWEPAPHR